MDLKHKASIWLMRIATWNCKGAFARKHSAALELAPDVIVVPESGRLHRLNNVLGASQMRSVEWIGANPHKGLGVISYGEYALRIHEAYDPAHRWILPLAVDGPIPFTLFAVWTVPHFENGTYIQCLFEALETYAELLKSPRVIWAGDFNQNPKLDKPSDVLKFVDFISRMKKLGLVSLYQLQSGEAHGAELQPTFFLHHGVKYFHHLDYIFASTAIREAGYELSVGEYSKWTRLSDHMPIVCRFQAGQLK